MKQTYVLIGASGRALDMYALPMTKQPELARCCQITGIFDTNPLRAEVLKKAAGLSCPIYTDADKMLRELKPGAAIITTIDRTHHEYIVKCLKVGVTPITEKPMTIDEHKCKEILEAEKQGEKKLVVTFNYRFMPYTTAVKELLCSGVVGKVLNVDFEYLLDTKHGADYFRRWHRRKENSGGLLVHKATHHFDLVNWWIEEEPVEVMAFGSRRFYGPTRAERGERCSTCRHTKTCEFYLDLSRHEWLKKLYQDCESADGYFRDRCVFADDIDIEDTMSVNVKYSRGALLSYSLIAHSPYEGFRASISGTLGRLELVDYHSGVDLEASAGKQSILFYDRQGRKIIYDLPKAAGDHGGGDARLRAMILGETTMPDSLGHKAGSFAGAISMLIGAAANKSIKEDRNIKINDLVPLEQYRQ